MPEWIPLNWLIISNPINWIMIVLMVLIGTIIFVTLAGAFGVETISD